MLGLLAFTKKNKNKDKNKKTKKRRMRPSLGFHRQDPYFFRQIFPLIPGPSDFLDRLYNVRAMLRLQVKAMNRHQEVQISALKTRTRKKVHFQT